MSPMAGHGEILILDVDADLAKWRFTHSMRRGAVMASSCDRSRPNRRTAKASPSQNPYSSEIALAMSKTSPCLVRGHHEIGIVAVIPHDVAAAAISSSTMLS